MKNIKLYLVLIGLAVLFCLPAVSQVSPENQLAPVATYYHDTQSNQWFNAETPFSDQRRVEFEDTTGQTIIIVTVSYDDSGVHRFEQEQAGSAGMVHVARINKLGGYDGFFVYLKLQQPGEVTATRFTKHRRRLLDI